MEEISNQLFKYRRHVYCLPGQKLDGANEAGQMGSLFSRGRMARALALPAQ